MSIEAPECCGKWMRAIGISSYAYEGMDCNGDMGTEHECDILYQCRKCGKCVVK